MAPAESPLATGHQKGGEAADGTHQVDGTFSPLERGDDGTGPGRRPKDLSAVRGDAAVVSEEEGGGGAGGRSGDETSSTSSRPSELFDSLDLSVA